jgi:hypothetical protein
MHAEGIGRPQGATLSAGPELALATPAPTRSSPAKTVVTARDRMMTRCIDIPSHRISKFLSVIDYPQP